MEAIGDLAGIPRVLAARWTPVIRTIFHVDMDAFFVSVEELLDPSLKGKPVVVGGKATERRRGFGRLVCSSQVWRPFGDAVATSRPALSPCHLPRRTSSRYREMSDKVFEVLKNFSPKVEMASIDEAYLDLTGTLSAARSAAERGTPPSRRGKGDTGLNCSIGIATSRLLAKVASDQAKPNGMLWIPPGAEAAFLAPLDVRKIPGVGKKTEETSGEVRHPSRRRSGAHR